MAADYRTLLGLVREFVDDAHTLDVCPHCTHDRGGHHDNACLLARAEKAIEPSKPKNDPTIMHVAPQDPCCSAPLGKAARSGALDDAETWNCSNGQAYPSLRSR